MATQAGSKLHDQIISYCAQQQSVNSSGSISAKYYPNSFRINGIIAVEKG